MGRKAGKPKRSKSTHTPAIGSESRIVTFPFGVLKQLDPRRQKMTVQFEVELKNCGQFENVAHGRGMLNSYRRKRASRLFQLPLEDFANQIRVCLAFAQFHHLAFEEIQGSGFAVFEVSNRSRICRNYFIAEFLDRVRVTDLGQSFLQN